MSEGIKVTAGYDEAHLVGALELWRQWCREEHDRDFLEDLWVSTMRGYVSSGQFLQVVAWDGDEPVGMVELLTHTDPMDGLKYGFGDHAYVDVSYRGQGVMSHLIEKCQEIARLLGVEKFVVPAQASGRDADFLREAYERRGYEVTGLILRRDA